ncbi:MAG TPA: bifunctional DNA primase/polymerase [Streptosporangiaceae bacterium]|nr:bifunctional DNA primase/polymerase [Streptosporangiaceae bacterium]
MVEAVLRRGRRRAVERMAVAAAEYAALGWPVCPGAYPPDRPHHGEAPRACSCDRIGCPAPGAHPMSPAWQVQATADPGLVETWWTARPRANLILVTGRTFDVLDVPAAAGTAALAMMDRSAVRPGPVAISAGNRALFFVATRGTPADEDEWWSCHLDCEPEVDFQVAGLRWHCRDSYVLAPPSRDGNALKAHWLRPPEGRSLPDGLRLLGFLADACEELA